MSGEIARRADAALSGWLSIMASIASRRGSAVSGISSFFSEQDMRHMAASIVSAGVSSRLRENVRLFFMCNADGGVEDRRGRCDSTVSVGPDTPFCSGGEKCARWGTRTPTPYGTRS